MALKKQWCPNCGQGWVVPVRILTTNQVVFVCDESEETWLSEDDVGPGTWSEKPRRSHYSYLNQVMEEAGLRSNEYKALEWLEV